MLMQGIVRFELSTLAFAEQTFCSSHKAHDRSHSIISEMPHDIEHCGWPGELPRSSILHTVAANAPWFQPLLSQRENVSQVVA
jgi:hypothetical protein